MPTKHRPDLKRVLESIKTACPHCDYEIPPREIRRIDTENMICPKCQSIFVPKRGRGK